MSTDTARPDAVNHHFQQSWSAKMNILVTGGLGFIGSHFIRLLITKYPNYKITNLDKMTYAGNPDNLKDIENNSNYTFVKGDICNAELVDSLVKENHAIINFAAESHVDRSIKDPSAFIKTDIEGTYTLLEAAKKHNTEKFLQISTDEVYGSIKEGSFSETSPLHPNSPYAASKAGADLVARSYFKTWNVPVIITRSSNNFGPNQYPEKFMSLFITNLLQGKKVPLYGDGKNIRDWIYVKDNCEAIDLVFHRGAMGEIYNIAGNQELQNITVVKKILALMDKDESYIEYVTDRLGHDRRYSLNADKVAKLGFEPSADFDKKLKETITWYKDNESWWKKLV